MSSPFYIARISFFMYKGNRPNFKINDGDGTLTIEAGNGQATLICDKPEETEALADTLANAATKIRVIAAAMRAKAVPS